MCNLLCLKILVMVIKNMSLFYLTQFKIGKFTPKHIVNLTYLVVAVVVTKSQNFSWFTKKKKKKIKSKSAMLFKNV